MLWFRAFSGEILSLSLFFFFLLWLFPQFGSGWPVSSLRLSSGHSGLVSTLCMKPAPPCSAPARCWQTPVSCLPLCWELRLAAWSVGSFFFFPPSYVVLWDSKTPHRPTSERVSWCLETSPPSWVPPWDGSLSLTLLSLFLSFIFFPTSFWREWAAFLDVWCPPLAFRICFLEVARHSNDLSMNLWGRKWSFCPIPLPS